MRQELAVKQRTATSDSAGIATRVASLPRQFLLRFTQTPADGAPGQRIGPCGGEGSAGAGADRRLPAPRATAAPSG